MTPDEIAADRAIIDAATPAPIEWDDMAGAVYDDGGWTADFAREEDGQFFIAARTRWPAALDEVERLRSGIASMAAMGMPADSLRQWARQLLDGENIMVIETGNDPWENEVARLRKALAAVAELTVFGAAHTVATEALNESAHFLD